MKTKILLALLFLFTICTSINAGDFLAKHKSRGHGGGEPKLIISASVGAGIPLGHFGKADTLAQSDTTHRNGYAKPGFHFNGSIGYRFTDNIGAMIQIGGNMNSFNTGTYSTQLAAQDGIVSPATLTTTATNNYIGSYLIGPVFTLPVSDQIDVDIKLLVGLMTMQFSDLTLNVNDPSIPATYVGIVATTATSTFAYGAGASIRFKASDMLGFKVGIDYIGGNPSFSSLKTVSGTSSGTLPKQSMTVGLLNISAGIVLGFWTDILSTILHKAESHGDPISKKARKIFNSLSAGGKVTMPIADSFWGAYFGMLIDKFGFIWMVNYDYPQK